MPFWNVAVFWPCLLGLVGPWSSARAVESEARAERIVRVGVYDFFPHNFRDADGRFKGISVDLLESVAAREGWTLQFEECVWAQCLELLEAGRFDVLPSVVRTEERAERWEFSQEEFFLDWGLVFGKRRSRIDTVYDLEGRRVGLVKGSLYGTELRALLATHGVKAALEEFASYSLLMDAMRSNRIDAVVTTNTVGLQFEDSLGLQRTQIVLSPAKLRVAARKTEGIPLLKALDGHLHELKADPGSTFFASRDRWLGIASGRTLPPALLWSLAALGCVTLISIVFILILRRVVRIRTRELAQTTERLTDSESLLRATFENAGVGIFHVSRAGVILGVNRRASEILGFAIPELVGRRVLELVESQEGVPGEAFMGDLVRGARPVLSGEARYLRRDGSFVWCQYILSCAKTHQKDEGLILLVLQDIDEKKKQAEELRRAKEEAVEANMAKTQFLANTSHEIRTPMNGVVGAADLLEATPLDPAQRDLVKMLRESAESMLVILSDILDFSRLELGAVRMVSRPLVVRELVDHVLRNVGTKAAEKGLRCSADVSEDVPERIMGDAVRIGEVLLNFLSNAVKFTSEGEVRLRVETLARSSDDDVALRFVVSDTGIGIEPEAQRRLFQRFYQVESVLSRKLGGTGLGLAISKKLVELMGGTIGVESEAGRGSSFWFEASFSVPKSLPAQAG